MEILRRHNSIILNHVDALIQTMYRANPLKCGLHDITLIHIYKKLIYASLIIILLINEQAY